MPLYYHGLIIIVNDDLCTRVVSNSHKKIRAPRCADEGLSAKGSKTQAT